MPHQDTDGHNGSAPQHQALKQALGWLFNAADHSKIRFREDCTWTTQALTFVAILWAWSDEKTLTGRFFIARKILIAMKLQLTPPAGSYQAFLKMLITWTPNLIATLANALRRHMQTALAERFTVHGFAVFGVDGSRLELPRTKSNERRFSPDPSRRSPPKPRRKGKGKGKSKGKGRPNTQRNARAKTSRERRAREKKANSPQMWLTTMFHVGTGLPWDWRLGPSDSSERDHFRQMIGALVAAALVTADAGFAGYDYWKALLDSNRHLLIRVGSNVRLLRDLGGHVVEKDGIVYLWPNTAAVRNQLPLKLRLVVQRSGKQPMYLVTSVLDESVLSDEQIVEIYTLRWGVELFYRHFKQTFERRKLRSHAGANAELEATWSLLGFWAMALHAEVQLASLGVPARAMSVAKFLHAYRTSLREYKSRPDLGESLSELISRAVIDPYKRANKASRDYPRKKRGHKIGAPQIHKATRDQIHRAQAIRDQQTLRLTA